MAIHPSTALFEGTPELPILSACDHYVGNAKLAAKAFAIQKELSGTFDITLDLEDGAAVGTESTLRDEFMQILLGNQNLYGRVGLRVHDFDSPFWRTDITTAVQHAGGKLSHITIPKTRHAAELKIMLEHLQLECVRAESGCSIPVHVLIESPTALAEIDQIASLPWVRCLELGLMDFVSSHAGMIPSSCMESPGQFDHPLIRRAKLEIASCALAHNKIAAHNVTTAYNNPEQTKQDALRARNEFGFLRMWSIHPAQIRPILEAFSPAPQELALAARVLLAAYQKDWAPISIDGRLHDRASYRYFWTLLQRAHSNGISIDPSVVESFFSAAKQGTTTV
jgi:citrate lyase subunit beta/citryl-CoA lyase